jgi:hypothetical protein
MATKPFRQRLELIEAVQYTGNNAAELLAFAPDFLWMDGSTLMVVRNPFPVIPTDWVFKREDGVTYDRLDDHSFNIKWTPGGGP